MNSQIIQLEQKPAVSDKIFFKSQQWFEKVDLLVKNLGICNNYQKNP